MNLLNKIQKNILSSFVDFFKINNSLANKIQIELNLDKNRKDFGDLNCNVAMILSKELKRKPIDIATDFLNAYKAKQVLSNINSLVCDIQIAGPGFINFTLNNDFWILVTKELYLKKEDFFKLDQEPGLKYLIEFVSANPTGPLHLGHGRGGIIGDVLANILNFIGHKALKEFYINDAGNQMVKLGNSFKVRCLQKLGQEVELPDDGYKGNYLIDLAKQCVSEFGKDLENKDEAFFQSYAKKYMLDSQKKDLAAYGIEFDNWFSEKTLHETGQVQDVLKDLQAKDLVYEKDGALWFRATKFGDDKDRVVKKSTGELTYIAADIAYHKNKFERGYDKLINVLGQDHHGYVKRLKSTIDAMGFDSKNLDVILYQLVSIKNAGKIERMSKRAGKFTTLREIIDIVGKDVARFFYLNRKAEAHLDFDLSVALKKTEENPVFYIQYAYVRTNGILKRSLDIRELKDFANKIINGSLIETDINDLLKNFGVEEFELIKKMISLQDILFTISKNYQTHLLSYYMIEFANRFHTYYAKNRIINEDADDKQSLGLSKARLLIIGLVRFTLQVGLNLLEVSCPKRM